MENYRLIPFDLSRAKTPENPSGLEVVTKGGNDARIICTDKKGMPIVALINHGDNIEDCNCYDNDGKSWGATEEFLYLKEPVTQRMMTNQELAWWLRDCPEEHREFIYYDDSDYATGHKTVYHDLEYVVCDADTPVDDILIRSNGGDWREPLISNGGEWREPYITEED